MVKKGKAKMYVGNMSKKMKQDQTNPSMSNAISTAFAAFLRAIFK